MPDASQTIHELKFNPAEFIEGMDKVIAKQEQYKQSVDTTGAEVAKLTKEIDRNVTNIDNLQKGMQSLDSTSKNYAADVKQMTALIEQHTAKLTALKEKAAELQKTYENDKKQVDNLSTAYRNATTAVQNLEKATGKGIGASLNPTQAITGVQKLAASIETLRAKMLVKQELLIKETDLTKIRQYNKEIDLLREEMLRISNAGKSGFDEMGNALAKTEVSAVKAAGSTNVLSTSFSFLRQAAYLIPGIGLAGIFNLIGEAAYNLGENIFASTKQIDAFAASQKSLNDALDSEEYKTAITSVSQLREDIRLAKDGVLDKTKVLNEYNETIGKTTGKVTSLDEAEQALGRNAEAYVKMTLYKTAAQLAYQDAAKEVVKAAHQQMVDEKRVADLTAQNKKTGRDAEEKGIDEFLKRTAVNEKNADKERADATVKTQTDVGDKLRKMAADIAKQYHFDIFGGDDDGKKVKEKKTRVIENVYKQKLTELKSRLASIYESTFTSEDTITAKIAAEFNKSEAELDKLVKERKLTKGQRNNLVDILGNISDAEFSKEMKAFNEKRKAAQKQIDDELERLRAEDVDKRIANIKGDFDQESAAIRLEYEKQKAALEKRFTDEQEIIQKGVEAGTIKPEAQEAATRELFQVYNKLYNDLDAYIARKQAELSQKSFDRSIQGVKDLFTGTFTVNNEETTKKIDALTGTYLKGETTYKKYQKDLTKILRDETTERLKLEKLDLEAQLASVNNRLSNPATGDTAEFTKKLKKQQLDLRNQISQNQRQADTNSASAKDADQQAELARLHDYVQAYVDIVSPILQIWQQANEAEAKSLDISIALQQKRVDAAQKVADRGNATYLKAEQDRMNDLQVKQADNARRQIAINAAIQASSALTAVVSGVAKAVITGNPLDAIAAVGAVIAAIGSGYALVKSLQQNQISFYEGTEDTGAGGAVDNKGGFHAILHPNERVLTKEQNKQLKGLSNEDLVEVVNRSKILVEQYKTPDLPELNYDRLEQAAHFHITSDGKLAALMEENTSKMDQVNANILRLNKTMKSIGASFTLDRNGMQVMLLEGFNQAEINKKI